MKTFQPKAKEIQREWHLIDARDRILGRLASEIVPLLTGKNKVSYAPHLDMGDYVVVINAGKVKVSGRKEKQKVYYRHSGYPGGFKKISYLKLKKEHPKRIIELAVKRMLADNRLRRPRMTRLRIFSGEEHPYRNKFKNG